MQLFMAAILLFSLQSPTDITAAVSILKQLLIRIFACILFPLRFFVSFRYPSIKITVIGNAFIHFSLFSQNPTILHTMLKTKIGLHLKVEPIFMKLYRQIICRLDFILLSGKALIRSRDSLADIGSFWSQDMRMRVFVLIGTVS